MQRHNSRTQASCCTACSAYGLPTGGGDMDDDIHEALIARRRLWTVFSASALLVAVAVAGLWQPLRRGGEASHTCSMTYMRPHYQRVPLLLPPESPWFLRKYSLYLYTENHPRPVDRNGAPIPPPGSRPVLFLPGSAGSYKQARSLASETTKLMAQSRSRGAKQLGLAWYTVDFGEEHSGFDGTLMEHQAQFAELCVTRLLELYRAGSAKGNPLRRPLLLVGHSMGGLVARAAARKVADRRGDSGVLMAVTLAAPHRRPPLPFSPSMAKFYKGLQRSLGGFPLLSLAGGPRDLTVPSALVELPPASRALDVGDGDEDHHAVVAAELTATPGVWASADHQATAWCNQLMKRLAVLLVRVSALEGANPSAAAAEARSLISSSSSPSFNNNSSSTATAVCPGQPAAPPTEAELAESVPSGAATGTLFRTTAATIKPASLPGSPAGALLRWSLSEQQQQQQEPLFGIRVSGIEPCRGFRVWTEERRGGSGGGSEAPDASPGLLLEEQEAALVPGRVRSRVPRTAAEHSGTLVEASWLVTVRPRPLLDRGALLDEAAWSSSSSSVVLWLSQAALQSSSLEVVAGEVSEGAAQRKRWGLHQLLPMVSSRSSGPWSLLGPMPQRAAPVRLPPPPRWLVAAAPLRLYVTQLGGGGGGNEYGGEAGGGAAAGDGGGGGTEGGACWAPALLLPGGGSVALGPRGMPLPEATVEDGMSRELSAGPRVLLDPRCKYTASVGTDLLAAYGAAARLRLPAAPALAAALLLAAYWKLLAGPSVLLGSSALSLPPLSSSGPGPIWHPAAALSAELVAAASFLSPSALLVMVTAACVAAADMGIAGIVSSNGSIGGSGSGLSDPLKHPAAAVASSLALWYTSAALAALVCGTCSVVTRLTSRFPAMQQPVHCSSCPDAAPVGIPYRSPRLLQLLLLAAAAAASSLLLHPLFGYVAALAGITHRMATDKQEPGRRHLGLQDAAAWGTCALAAAMSLPSFVAWALVKPLGAQHRPCLLEGALALPAALLGLLRAFLAAGDPPRAQEATQSSSFSGKAVAALAAVVATVAAVTGEVHWVLYATASFMAWQSLDYIARLAANGHYRYPNTTETSKSRVPPSKQE